MIAAIIILSVATAILLITHIGYRRQVSKTCRRLAFIKNNDTNMQLLSDTDFHELNTLEKEINEIIIKSSEISIAALQKENTLKETIANISHDIRTPLTSLDGYFQLLSDAKTDEERQRYISIIKNRIESLNNMLEELFLYTKLQNDSYEPEMENVNFSQLVFDTAFSFYDVFAEKGTEPQVNFCEEKLTINANRDALQRIIQNIIKNAIVHGKEQVAFTLEKQDNKAVFTCSNAVENPEEIDADKVFTRFYKADDARTRNSSGLGLAIAHDFTAKMGGEIKAVLNNDIFSIEVKFDIV